MNLPSNPITTKTVYSEINESFMENGIIISEMSRETTEPNNGIIGMVSIDYVRFEPEIRFEIYVSELDEKYFNIPETLGGYEYTIYCNHNSFDDPMGIVRDEDNFLMFLEKLMGGVEISYNGISFIITTETKFTDFFKYKLSLL